MESFGNERSVQQGEDWNLDLLLSASDREYIPFIVSSERKNPYFAITVASTKFEKNLRYVKTWWNSVDNQLKIPRFYQTTPQYYGEINDIDGSKIRDLGEIRSFTSSVSTGGNVTVSDYVYKTGSANISVVDSAGTTKTYNDSITNSYVYKYTSQDDVTDEYGNKPIYYRWFDYFNESASYEGAASEKYGGLERLKTAFIPQIPSTDMDNITYNDKPDTRLLYYYTLASDEIDPTLGHKPYYYFYFDYQLEMIDGVETYRLIGREFNYECNLIQNFLSKDTREWRSQNYLYQITLVSGYLMHTVLNEIYSDKLNAGFNLDDYPKNQDGTWESTIDTKQDLISARFKYIKTRWPNEFQSDIDEDSPLGYIEIPEPILRPTKLEVFNNLRTLI